ncbi:MAG: CHAP domain-containing protein, partial [Pseudomonadota bacterium]
AWPVNGFIYPDKPGKSERLTGLSSADMPQKARATETPVSRIGADFLRGIRPETDMKAAPVRRQLSYSAPRPAQPRPARLNPTLADDPIGRIIASRMK